jgi:hypothetical protein
MIGLHLRFRRIYQNAISVLQGRTRRVQAVNDRRGWDKEANPASIGSSGPKKNSSEDRCTLLFDLKQQVTELFALNDEVLARNRHSFDTALPARLGQSTLTCSTTSPNVSTNTYSLTDRFTVGSSTQTKLLAGVLERSANKCEQTRGGPGPSWKRKEDNLVALQDLNTDTVMIKCEINYSSDATIDPASNCRLRLAGEFQTSHKCEVEPCLISDCSRGE